MVQCYSRCGRVKCASEKMTESHTGRTRLVRQVIAGLAATLSLVCAGYHFGWSSPSLLKLQADDSDLLLTSDQGAWVVSAFTFGCIFGPFIGCVTVDWWGRKWSLLFAAVPYLISTILIALGNHYWWLLAARFTAGLGSGISYTAAPMYLGEIADDRIRGALGAMIGHMLNAGILIAYCVGPWLSRASFGGFGAAFPLLFALIFFWMPESPYFSVMKRKSGQAESSLKWLTIKSDVSEELKTVEQNVEFDRRNPGTYKELVTSPGNRRATIIVVGLMFAQQFSGVGAVLAYSSLIFDASEAELNSSISVIITGVVQFLTGFMTILTVDLAGRKPLLLLSIAGSIFFLSAEALYFQLQALNVDVSSISWLPMTAIIGFLLSYALGLGTLPHVVLSEIFPYNVKAKAAMIVASVGAAGGMIVAKLYQVIADAYGIHVSFWCFAGISVFSGIFIYFILPETKQRSLRDIQNELQNIKESERELDKPAA